MSDGARNPGLALGGQGRIPFRVRIGVTGHRHLADEGALAKRVEEILVRIQALAPSSPWTPVNLRVVSSLAEGADRLVVREVLTQPGGDLTVVLPLPREAYSSDFEDAGSREEFEELLEGARQVVEIPGAGTREEAYERAGRSVVDRSDMVVAIWDGKPSRGRGGTAEVVAYAQDRGVPVFRIDSEGDHRIEEPGRPLDGLALRRLNEYNRSTIVPDEFRRHLDVEAERVLPDDDESGASALRLAGLREWVMPYFVRADVLARRYQRGYNLLGDALFLFASAAVALVASQALFAPQIPELVWIEVGLMLGLLLIVAVGRWRGLHGRWISCRFLAERFRSAPFLALAGVGERATDQRERLDVGVHPEEWVRRAFTEVWDRRPRADVTGADVEALRRFLASAWIGGQVRYHRNASRKLERRHLRLTRGIGLLFGVTLLGSLLHSIGVGGHHESGFSWAGLFVFLSIAMPALGAAIGGIRAQREYHRNADRYRQMSTLLEAARSRMEAAPDPKAVRAAAAETEAIMLEENRDWFGIMQFHDFELHI